MTRRSDLLENLWPELPGFDARSTCPAPVHYIFASFETHGSSLVDLSVVLSAFSLLFLAEMGGKSQLLAMTLAHRYLAASVVVGTCTAFAVMKLLAVLVGQVLFELVSQELMLLAAAGLFLYVGHHSWRDADGKRGG